MANYELNNTGACGIDKLYVTAHPIYGRSRLGVDMRKTLLYNGVNVSNDTLTRTNRTLSLKQYELSNHLGNVLGTITDKKIPKRVSGISGPIDYFDPEITTISDYYAFGAPMPTRNWSDPNMKYKYGFNGKEEDNEINIDGGSYDFGARIYDSRLGRWLSVDPMSNKFASWSTYNSFGSNPISNIDPDGRKYLNFDQDGNYIGVTKDNWLHNLFVGSKGRLLDENGKVTKKFKFASDEDIEDIENGIITKIVVVKESEIIKMLHWSGVFWAENKSENNSLGDRYKYVKKEGEGGHKMDFSYTQIPKMYPEASKFPLAIPSKLIFLVDDVAHNQMNFGNFMFGVASQALGLTKFETLTGAHWNSLVNSSSNGYNPQFDSADDQESIRLGHNYGYERDLDELIRVAKVSVSQIISVSETSTSSDTADKPTASQGDTP